VSKKRDKSFFVFCLLVVGPMYLLGKLSNTPTPIVAPKVSETVQQSTTSIAVAQIENHIESKPAEYRYVTGTKLNVRLTPEFLGIKIDVFKLGEKLLIIEENGDWAKVKSVFVEGWVLKKFLSSNLTTKEVLEPPKQVKLVKKPQVDTADIIKKIITNSIASYSGRCPCPYFTDRAGRSCGRRSAYSRAGGASVICYPEDVTPEMISSFAPN
jgi:SH3-like domain-containing protein